MNNLIFLFVIFLTIQGFAQSEAELYKQIVLVCPNKIQLLDYFEGENLRGNKYSKMTGFSQLIESISLTMPDRAKLYQVSNLQFLSMVSFTQNEKFGEVATDDLILEAPTNCQYQVLLQTNFENLLVVQKKLWNMLNPIDLAGAQLNWSIAKEIYQSDKKIPGSSVYIRNLNSLVPGDNLSKLAFQDLTQILIAARLFSVRKQGVLIDLSKPISFFDNTQILNRAYSVLDSKWTFQESEGFNSTVRLKEDQVEFYANGAVSSLRFEGNMIIHTEGGEILIATQEPIFSVLRNDERVSFYSNGRLKSGVARSAAILETPYYKIKVDKTEEVWPFDYPPKPYLLLFSDGRIELISNVSGIILFQDKWLNLVEHSSLSWYENGQIFSMNSRDQFNVKIQNKLVSFIEHAYFFENGQLKCGKLNEPTVFFTTFVKKQLFLKGEEVCFDEIQNLASYGFN
jgi:hypothetical protein